MTQVAPTEAPTEIFPAATVAAIEAAKPKLVTIKLERNYRPRGTYEVVGWDRPEKSIKRPDGKTIVIEEAAFVTEVHDDELSPDFGKVRPAPPPLSGTGTGGKIWAGTTIRLPVEEAKTVRKLGIGSYELDD